MKIEARNRLVASKSKIVDSKVKKYLSGFDIEPELIAKLVATSTFIDRSAESSQQWSGRAKASEEEFNSVLEKLTADLGKPHMTGKQASWSVTRGAFAYVNYRNGNIELDLIKQTNVRDSAHYFW